MYEKSKSREALTQLNSVSFSVSYKQVIKFRSNLCAYTLHKNKDKDMTMPSHLNTTDFMIAAFDNFNHKDASSLSGNQVTNDTVLVLFQNKSDLPYTKKCNVTDIPPIQPGRKALENLPCQKLISYFASNVKSKPLPANFKTYVGQPYECDKTEEVLLAARTMTLPHISNCCSHLPEKKTTWHGMHAFISKD